MKTSRTTTTVDHTYENEAGGYTAELQLTIVITPGERGDRMTPSCGPEFELTDVKPLSVTITTGNYEHEHIFSQHATPAEVTLAKIIINHFEQAYETDDAMRDRIECMAAERATDDDEAAADDVADARREELREAASYF